MAIEIVDFPIKNGGSFHGKMLVYQRVKHIKTTFFQKITLNIYNPHQFIALGS